MEEGALAPDEKRAQSERTDGSMTPDKEGTSSQSQDEATRPDGTDMRDESPPDGDETLQEWQEGPDRVVERRRGPGEEVSL